jgi:hypothetical protein
MYSILLIDHHMHTNKRNSFVIVVSETSEILKQGLNSLTHSLTHSLRFFLENSSVHPPYVKLQNTETLTLRHKNKKVWNQMKKKKKKTGKKTL